MRAIEITSYPEDAYSFSVLISKDINYVQYQGSFIRVNVDEMGIPEDEEDVFPIKLSSEIMDIIADISESDSEISNRIYYSNDSISTTKELLSSIADAADYSDIETLFLYRTNAKRDSDRTIVFNHFTLISFKVGGLFIPIIEIDNMLDIKEVLTDKVLYTINTDIELSVCSPFKEKSNHEITIIDADEVSICSIKDDYAFAEDILSRLIN